KLHKLEEPKRKLEQARDLAGAGKLAREFGVLSAGEIADPERELALAVKANRELKGLVAASKSAPVEVRGVLFEIASDVLEASIPTWGKKPRRLAYRCVLAKLAAAVTALTALKQEGGVGGAIALVAACSGIAGKP